MDNKYVILPKEIHEIHILCLVCGKDNLYGVDINHIPEEGVPCSANTSWNPTGGKDGTGAPQGCTRIFTKEELNAEFHPNK